MKLFIYLAFLSLVFCLVTSVSVKSSFKTEANTKSHSEYKSMSELTFSTEETNPESATVMESIFSKKAIKVESRFLTIGEENNIKDPINFGDAQNNLRFKQHNVDNGNMADMGYNYDFKNMEIPEIKGPAVSKNVDEGSNAPIYTSQQIVDIDRVKNIQDQLLSKFKHILERGISGTGGVETVSRTSIELKPNNNENRNHYTFV